MNISEIISELQLGDIILFNYRHEGLYLFNYMHSSVFLGNKFKTRLNNIFNNKIYLNGLNDEDFYFFEINRTNLIFTTAKEFLQSKYHLKVYKLINYDLLSINEYDDVILQNKFVDTLLKNYCYTKIFLFDIRKRINCLAIIFKTLEELLNVKFKKRLFFYNEFILYNHNFFKKKFFTIINRE
jgi:hypothetical protein